MKGRDVYVDGVYQAKHAFRYEEYRWKRIPGGWKQRDYNDQKTQIETGDKLTCIDTLNGASIMIRIDEAGEPFDDIQFKITTHTKLKHLPGKGIGSVLRRQKVTEIKSKIAHFDNDIKSCEERLAALKKTRKEFEAKQDALEKYASDEEEMMAIISDAKSMPAEKILERLKNRIRLK